MRKLHNPSLLLELLLMAKKSDFWTIEAIDFGIW